MRTPQKPFQMAQIRFLSAPSQSGLDQLNRIRSEVLA